MDNTSSTGSKKFYLIIGVRGTGSGSLTFPEDFDIVGVTDDHDRASRECDELNAGNGFEYDEHGDQCQEDDLSDEFEYSVEEVDFLSTLK